MTKDLITAYDPDEIEILAQIEIEKTPIEDRTPALMERSKEKAQQELILEASKTFNGELNKYLENVRKLHEQIIDHINIDTVKTSEWDKNSVDKATQIVKDFTDYIEENKDEIQALSIFYHQPYQRRTITFQMIREVMDKLKLDKPTLAPHYVWSAYEAIEDVKSKRPQDELTALVSLIRHVCGIDGELFAFDKTIDRNFQQWILRQNAGQHNRFTTDQMDWLRMIKDHIISSYHLEPDDLDYTPFDAQGGKGRMYQLFGKEMNGIIEELNEVLTA